MICGSPYVAAVRQTPNSRGERALCMQARFEQGEDDMNDRNSVVGIFTIEILIIIFKKCDGSQWVS